MPIAKNSRAFHQYEIVDRLEAGIALTGTEVKSLRGGRVSLAEGFARIENGQAYLYEIMIPEYPPAGPMNHDPKRRRKLLLHRREIDKLAKQTSQKGFTLVPLALYFKDGYAKVEIGVGRGKTLYDKRERIKEREEKRKIARLEGQKRIR